MQSAALELSINCPKCDQPVPLEGPLERVNCPHCQRDIEIPHDYWKDILKDVREDLKEFAEGEGRNSTIFGQFHTTLLYGKQQPRCGKCKTNFLLPKDLTVAAELTCPKCSQKSPLAPAPAWLSALDPTTLAFVGALVLDQPAGKEAAISEPVIFLCPKCGGSLSIDGKERLVKCQFCTSQIYLPDDLWLRLHPAKVKERWYAVFE
jgi:DNA-directed RNA polymerase subunit RPC12/RpoP